MNVAYNISQDPTLVYRDYDNEDEESFFGKMRMLENKSRSSSLDDEISESDDDSFMNEILQGNSNIQSVLLRRAELEKSIDTEQQEDDVIFQKEGDVVFENEENAVSYSEEDNFTRELIEKENSVLEDDEFNRCNQKNDHYETKNVNNITQSYIEDETTKTLASRENINPANTIVVRKSDPALLSVAEKARLFQSKMHNEKMVKQMSAMQLNKENAKIRTKSNSMSASSMKKSLNRSPLQSLNVNHNKQHGTKEKLREQDSKLNESTISSISVGSSLFSGINNTNFGSGLSPRTAKVVAMDNPATRAAYLRKNPVPRSDCIPTQTIKPVYFAGRLGKDRFGAYRNYNAGMFTWSGGMYVPTPTSSTCSYNKQNNINITPSVTTIPSLEKDISTPTRKKVFDDTVITTASSKQSELPPRSSSKKSTYTYKPSPTDYSPYKPQNKSPNISPARSVRSPSPTKSTHPSPPCTASPYRTQFIKTTPYKSPYDVIVRPATSLAQSYQDKENNDNFVHVKPDDPSNNDKTNITISSNEKKYFITPHRTKEVKFNCSSEKEQKQLKVIRAPTPAKRFNFNESVTSEDNDIRNVSANSPTQEIILTPKGTRITKDSVSSSRRNHTLHIDTIPNELEEISPFGSLEHKPYIHKSTPMAQKDQLTNTTSLLLQIDESGIDSIMDDLDSELDDFDMIMMNQHASHHEAPTTPQRPPQLDDIFALSPSPNHVVELESIINDIMITASNGSSTDTTTNRYNRLISPTYNIHLHYDQFADEPAKTSPPKYIDTSIQSSGSRCSDYINPLNAFKKKKKARTTKYYDQQHRHDQLLSTKKSKKKKRDVVNSSADTIHYDNRNKMKQGISFFPQLLHQGKSIV